MEYTYLNQIETLLQKATSDSFDEGAHHASRLIAENLIDQMKCKNLSLEEIAKFCYLELPEVEEVKQEMEDVQQYHIGVARRILADVNPKLTIDEIAGYTKLTTMAIEELAGKMAGEIEAEIAEETEKKQSVIEYLRMVERGELKGSTEEN